MKLLDELEPRREDGKVVRPVSNFMRDPGGKSAAGP